AIAQVINDANHRISQLVATVEKSAAIAAYLDNEELALEVTRGLASNDIVAGVSLQSTNGMRIISGEPFSQQSENIQHYNLASPFMPDEQAGIILIRADDEYINVQAQRNAKIHVMTLAFHSLIVTILVIFLVHRLLTQPLRNVAEGLHKIEPGSQFRVECPRNHEHSEIGLLVRDTNQLLTAVQNTLEGERRLREYVESLQQKARAEAERDPLTQLLNRRAGERAITQALEHADANDLEAAIMLIDLDRFKPINDTYGHDAGDTALISVANRLQDSLRKSDIVIRWGGDEFLILVMQGHDRLDAPFVARKLLEELGRDISILDNKTVQIGASIGIALFPQHGKSADMLFELADKAMYHIKHSGRNDYFIHTPKHPG
ncbi:MAG: GGDEF domain-containing protein, partial [Ketobacteraceae bacterium]|nr:GGDEF domain-containing protein [Ketobacteraceae bacterium]